MKVKINPRLTWTADRLQALQLGVEGELRRTRQLLGVFGIVSADGFDVDNSQAAGALVVNVNTPIAFDVQACTVLFKNGEFIDVGSNDLAGIVVSTAVTDAQVVRLEYGEVDDGDLDGNPVYNYQAKPIRRIKTPAEMLVLETVTSYNAQSIVIKNNSVVLGVARYVGGELVLDNGRDTYSFSRPWASVVDTTHRSYLGTGVKSVTNPHAQSFNDSSVGSFSAWQAFAGPPAAVLARPTGFGRLAGSICREVIPAGNFLVDITGTITGVAGAAYAELGFWPNRLLFAQPASSTTEAAAWIPQGRKILALMDPIDYASTQSVTTFYTTVTAGALPGSIIGATFFDVTDPTDNEILVAGGNFFQALVDKRVYFTDVGAVPMPFDVLVDEAGKVYKRPEVLYCNTRLDTLGASAAPLTTQPRAPTRLRLALSNYNPGFTQVQVQLQGRNEANAVVTEVVTWNGPLPAVAVSYTEQTGQRKFTTNVFSAVEQVQVLVRNGDGPNTTLSIFAEHTPERPATQDHLLLASVFWNGAEISTNYVGSPNVVLDRRIISLGGAAKVPDGLLAALARPGPNEVTSASQWVTIVEDFSDPVYMRYPQPDAALTTTTPVELPLNSRGVRAGYLSRRIPFGASIIPPLVGSTSVFLQMLSTERSRHPAYVGSFTCSLTMHREGGAPVVLTGNISTRHPPFVVNLAGTLPTDSYYAATVEIPANADFGELFQGFLLHVRA